MAYTPRTSKYSPTDMTWKGQLNDTNKYWYSNVYSTSDPGICLPNCTTYAMGRAGEIAGKSVMGYDMLNQSGFGMARDWYGKALWEKTQTPSLGAIACWTDSGSSTLFGGHVAVVEATDGTLAGTYLSMSGYQDATPTGAERTYYNPGETSWYFRYETFNTCNSWYAGGNPYTGQFQGFLKNPYADTSPTPTPTTYTVTLNVDPTGAGYCTGGGTYNAGDEATFTAIPNKGYEFLYWNDKYTGNPRYWTIEASFSLTAYFKKKEAQSPVISLESSITKKAIEVLYGKYGSGTKRKRLLGDDYKAVQYQVNYLLYNYDLNSRMAMQVLIGLWGNGAVRKKRLIAAGYNYYKIQKQVDVIKKKKVL
jgi:hypothetical protein